MSGRNKRRRTRKPAISASPGVATATESLVQPVCEKVSEIPIPPGQPLVAVIVVTYNSRRHLPDLLTSLRAQTHSNFRLVVVDSNSADDTRSWLIEHWSDVALLSSSENLGYRRGNQWGMEVASAHGGRELSSEKTSAHGKPDSADPEYLLILNDDVELHPNAIERMVSCAESNADVAIVAPAIIVHGDPVRLNAAGSSLLPCGFYSARGKGRDYGEFCQRREIAAASGCCFLYRNSAYRELGGFDGIFDSLPGAWHASAEDLDLCWRVWRAGYGVRYEPAAILWHKYRQRPMHEQRYASLVSGRLAFLALNMPQRALLSMLPALIITEMALAAYSLLRGPAFIRSWIAGYRWLWGSRRRLRELRGLRCARSRAPDASLKKLMQSKIRLAPSVERNPFLYAAAYFWFGANALALGALSVSVLIQEQGVRR